MPTQPDHVAQVNSEGVVPVLGSEPLLLGRESVLRQIPVNVEPKQAFFLDGIRHAVEIMDVAYGRLRNALTDLALNPPHSNSLPEISAHVFLDAWGFVDAIDRFRMMYTGLLRMKPGVARGGISPLLAATQEFRNLRNVGDHLAQRADLVISKNGAASGELSWLTGAQLEPQVIAWHCTLRPGTLRAIPPTAADPITSSLDWPTDSIRLSAGGYHGDLSKVRAHVALRVNHLETQLQRIFQQPTQENVPAISDIFTRRAVKRTGSSSV